ncbi:ficolin-1-like isoform X2 [Apostichopus japonicus]|uniref:ficolin-1-like isoform X2 n=1 Tax=Stichopus japonicus TaxID=307972 RepID=UPI003AB543F3
MEKGGLKQCRSPLFIHLLIAVILLLGGRSQAARYNPGPCPGAAPKPNDHVTKEATNMYSSKPVETTPKQTTSSETTGSTIREATNLSSSKPVETTPMQTTSSETTGSTVREATNLYSSKPVETTPMQTTSGDASGSTVREASESVGTTPKQTTTGGDCPRDDPSIEMTNCLDWFNAGCNKTSTYTIKPTNWNGPPFEVFCNMTDGGGWTVFQHRVNGSVDFYRNWQSYKEGFGELDHEFWLGNDKLYYLTNQGDYQLRIDMVNKDGAPYYAKFDLFRINDESDNYKLSKLGNYSGTADTDGGAPGGFALSYHLNSAFTTFDRDNDKADSTNCADILHGAWWYKSCANSNLNGDYMAADNDGSSIYWYFLPGGHYNIKYTEMKIRPV